MENSIKRLTGVLLIQLDAAGTRFALLNALVNGNTVLMDENTTVAQSITALQHSQADNAAHVLRAATRLTTLQLQLAQAGIIPDAETQPDTAE